MSGTTVASTTRIRSRNIAQASSSPVGANALSAYRNCPREPERFSDLPLRTDTAYAHAHRRLRAGNSVATGGASDPPRLAEPLRRARDDGPCELHLSQPGGRNRNRLPRS